MDGVHPALLVFSVLGLVAIAAVSYVPANFLGNYRRLAERFETNCRPKSITFPGEYIMVGRLIRGPYFFAKSFGDFARFDVTIDDEGLWFLYDGPLPSKAPDCMLVPWDRVKLKNNRGHIYFFDIEASDPVEISVAATLGEAICRRIPKISETVSEPD